MPYMQRQRLLSLSALADDTTLRWKLPRTGKYTAFELYCDCERQAVRADADAPHTLESCIDKIEILQGGARAIYSLTGLQADAMNYWDFKRPNPRRYRQQASSDNIIHFFLMGGRDLYDREYGFDMEKLGESYLEYTYNLHEGDNEYFEANMHYFRVYGWRWMGPGAPNFKGFMRSRQLAAWATTGTSVLKTIEIPTQYPIRRIGVQARSRARSIGGTFTEIEVRVNEGEYSPVIIKNPMQFTMAEVVEYGLHNVIGGVDVAIVAEATDLPWYWAYMGSSELTGYADLGVQPYFESYLQMPVRIRPAGGATKEIAFVTRGYGFQKCMRIGFDHEYDGFDLLKLSPNDVLDVVLTEAADGRNGSLFVQDVATF